MPDDNPSGWSERQLATLADLFAAIVEPTYEGESRRHAELAARTLSEVADPADLRQIRLTLSLLGSSAGSWLLAQHGRAAREQMLRAWSTSRLPQRRTFFQLVKRLACFFAYADPGDSGTNRRWAAIGYSMPDEPVASDEPIAKHLLAADQTAGDPLRLEADVVVVGSGAGGGVIAARLAESGRDVLIVEAAPYIAEAELPRNELNGFDQLYLDHGLASSADLSVSILAGAAVGGGTLINWTTSIEPPAEIRQQWARRHGLAGFDAADTDAHLARLRAELGFCAPPNIPAKDQLILDGAAKLGWEAAPTERNAADCGDCGACSFGCRRGAKKSGQRLHLAIAADHGARLLTGALVDRVDVASGAAAGASGRLTGGRPFRVRAKAVVVCAGALRTPTLLMKSGLRNPALGRNLRLHPTVVVAALMPKRVDMWRGTTQAARSLELLSRGIVIESAPAHPGLVAVGLPWRGRAQMAALMAEVADVAPLIGIVRDGGSGRVSLTRAGNTRITYRLSRDDVDTARTGLLALARLGRAGGARRLVALGTPGESFETDGDDRDFSRYLDRLARFDLAPNRGAVFSAHQMGSARAGGNPRTSACDPFGRVRSNDRGETVGGLFVGDASLFPTAIGVNPMVTVMAMAARVADAIAAG